MAYPFEEHEDFGLLKAADIPCPNIAPDFRCSIHSDLAKCGFGGCVAYSCAGAGQRVTQVLFDGETWRDDPDLLSHMTYALRVLRPIHEALLVLQEAAALPLPKDLQERCAELTRALCPEAPSSVWDFEEDSVQNALAALPDFVETIAPYTQHRS
ncbi:hypothetical protein GC1_02510 [Leisingera sp. ANG1]|uniref:hypothetical protein n=1 Tax=Leisingera sp. ANG-S TaxID=1577898 RepID=UPI0002F621E8|nr:hypothetical protein [Leisingera sp. ANG-S]KIC25290.1 hypothetical protein RA23_05290 [Leisingera sp. ANG-S3]KIC54658.1 hypothetical protein RA22_04760 [Leisingera sp. ANG-S]KID10576.1 hypothetical protein GC1_02510 [Leisingera sp. ANG1]